MINLTKLGEWDFSPNAIVHGECISVMAEMQPNSIDMVLCDLPYGATCLHWDSIIPTFDLWAGFERVCKPNAAIVLTATQPFSSLLVMSKPEWFRYEIIWRKNKATGHLNAKKMPMRSHENILIFYKELPTYNPQMTSGHDPLHYAVNTKGSKLYGKYDGVESRTGATDRYPKSVLDFDVVNQSERIHETQKPLDLFSYLVKTYSKAGDIVLDPTAGSLTTAAACITSGRKYICIEKEEKYIQDGLNRLPVDIFNE